MVNGILGAIFGGAAAQALEALLRGGDLTVRQVARVAGLSPSSASVALRTLEARGLVRGVPVGTAVQYRLNEEHFALPHVRALVAEGHQLRSDLPQLIESRLGSRPRCVILFGSMARGDARKDSDMDLLVVARDEEQLEGWDSTGHELAEWLTGRIGGPLDVVMVTAPSAAELRRPFWRNVLREGQVLDGEPLA